MTADALYILYAVLAAGAAGVALILPSARPEAARLRLGGTVLACAALAALVVYAARLLAAPADARFFFIAFSVIAVVAAVRVVTHPRPVYSALYFVLVVLAVTGLCVLIMAEFLGIALVIVYAGAILVTYVFVIMLAQQSGLAEYDREAREPWAAVAIAFALVAATTMAMSAPDAGTAPVAGPPGLYQLAAAPAPAAQTQPAAPVGNVKALGGALMTTYVIAVELAGVLLLIAVVGAIVISQKRIEPEALTPYEREQQREDEDMTKIGREVKPF